MSPATRTQKRHDYVPHVLEAVELLAKENGQGASRQSIEKYLEGTLNEETNAVTKLPSPVIKSAIRQAINSGLLVHASGVGLNGSFVLPKKGNDFTTINRHKGKKAVITKEAKPCNISSLASELQDTSLLFTNITRRNIQHAVPLAEAEEIKEDRLNVAKKPENLKTILKTPKRRKLVNRVKRKNGTRTVKFCSPPRVIFITPCIKRKPKRKT